MRQKVRLALVFLWFFLFPVTLNFFSPYVSIDGAMLGLVSGSVLVFLLMFLTGLFFSRAWCGWVCPVAGLSEAAQLINPKPVNVRKLKIIRYTVFSIWFGILSLGFVLAGGIKGLSPLHLTEKLFSVDEPLKYITYYFVLFALWGLSILIGRRGACHAICWMSPFLVAGFHLGRMLRLPQLRIVTQPNACVGCKKCDAICPMSIPVSAYVKQGEVHTSDCILCCKCADTCPNKVLKPAMRIAKHNPDHQ